MTPTDSQIKGCMYPNDASTLVKKSQRWDICLSSVVVITALPRTFHRVTCAKTIVWMRKLQFNSKFEALKVEGSGGHPRLGYVGA